MSEQNTAKTQAAPALGAPVAAAPDTTPEAVPDTTPEAVPDTTPEAVPEAAPETTPEAVPEAVPETVPETTPEAVPEAVPETAPTTAPTTAATPRPDAPPETAPAASRDRRRLRALLRWTAAVVVFAAAGTGAAYGMIQPERADLPGLSTEADGRWSYPALSWPTLPPGAPLPGAEDNKAGIHYAALSALLLPSPGAARPDGAFKADKDGNVSTDAFLEEYAPATRAKIKEGLDHDGLRQITGRGWTMPDGTRARIYLLRAHSGSFRDSYEVCNSNSVFLGAEALTLDPHWSKAKSGQPPATGRSGPGRPAGVFYSNDISVYVESVPYGDEQTKVGCLKAGDVQAVIIQTRKGEVATVPFHQTVILQSQMLS
ncbi:hypothetical protein [Streptomyces sp. NPDC048269]|uniref:hypothetical protein n=1 Tax=Streptomyces sp. NPDC048269 TaxID=3155753 RepID=UPI0034403F28